VSSTTFGAGIRSPFFSAGGSDFAVNLPHGQIGGSFSLGLPAYDVEDARLGSEAPNEIGDPHNHRPRFSPLLDDESLVALMGLAD